MYSKKVLVKKTRTFSVYELQKDIFATFAYDFEHLRFLVKSFACAHGEIKGSRLWWNILLKQNVKLNPPTRRRGEFHTPQAYFTLQSNISPTRKGGFSWKTDKSKLVGFSGGVRGIWTLARLLTAYSLSRGAPSASWVSLRIKRIFLCAKI